MDFTGKKLGLVPSHKDKLAKAPRLSGGIIGGGATPPPMINRTGLHFIPGLDENDKIGDCAAVGLANYARQQSLIHGMSVDIPTQRVVEFYSRFGYRPGVPGTDRGAELTDVLTSQEYHGWDVGLQAPLVAAWGVLPLDRDTLARALGATGGLLLGVALSLSDQSGAMWDTAPGEAPPGSWGYHCITAWDYNGLYDSDLVRVSAWGTLFPATWRWLASRVTEAYAVLWDTLGPKTWQVYCDLRKEFGLD